MSDTFASGVSSTEDWLKAHAALILIAGAATVYVTPNLVFRAANLPVVQSLPPAVISTVVAGVVVAGAVVLSDKLMTKK